MLFEPCLYKHCLWDFGQQYLCSSVFLRPKYILIFLCVHLSKALLLSVDHAAWISCSPSVFCCGTLIPSSSFVCLIKIFVKTPLCHMPFISETKKAIKACKISHRDRKQKISLLSSTHMSRFVLNYALFTLLCLFCKYPKITT